MNCEKCNQNPATIQLYMNINGKRVEMPLCASCYAEVRNQANFGANEFPGASGSPFDDIFRQLSGAASQANREQRSQAQVQTQTAGGGNGLLDEFGTNLTDMAKNEQLDPVIGRDKEIKRVIEILNRRNKNNPVLIGEPGVGKTAVVEGLANAIV
ncbi:ATP-dependent Clp protease ATP-binding subunit, partial [Listeria monocytogenes]|nr:ATP-dependent Clp protease ATP-binding subunit [Listeria monocytogenes]